MSTPRLALLVSALSLLSAGAQAQQVLLRIQQDGQQQLSISHAQKGRFALQPERSEVAEGELLVIGRDAQGQELFRQATRRPNHIRAEVFDPRTGKIQQAKDLSGAGALEVRLPYPEGLASIELQEQRSGRVGISSANALKRIGRNEIEALAQADAVARSRISPMAVASGSAMLWESGATGARMDLILIGDGFTSAELGRWQTEARRIADGILADPLFARHKNAFNIRRVDVASAQSGVSEGGVTRNTALGTVIGCYNIERLVCVDENKVLNTVSPLTPADGRDVYLVVANSSTYGGAALGNVGTMTLHPQSIEVALHEIGHSAFNLADEYDYGSCGTSSEPSEVNVTRQTSRANIKWRQFINANTPVPTQAGSVANGTVGLFQGGKYCTSGVYRPTENSRMRALNNPWHGVNEARAQAVFDSYTGTQVNLPAITSQPASVTVDAGRTATFSVSASSSAALSYQWRRNGSTISGATAASYTTPATTAADNGANFSVVVTNSRGSVTSNNATLTVRSVGGGTTVSGNLASGGKASFPSASPGYHYSANGGSFSATLSGPAAPVDFELFLYKWNGSAWAVVAKSEGPTSQESISYSGTAGYYYWEVKSYSGSGGFTLRYSLPN
ncbi:M64 family metallopeptidase [Inhella sp.]|uniref:M64 family metallopeptidase n=1 Tax=Inhella sp. TaxID=1921806 RepID=UPI0035AE1ABD